MDSTSSCLSGLAWQTTTDVTPSPRRRVTPRRSPVLGQAKGGRADSASTSTTWAYEEGDDPEERRRGRGGAMLGPNRRREWARNGKGGALRKTTRLVVITFGGVSEALDPRQPDPTRAVGSTDLRRRRVRGDFGRRCNWRRRRPRAGEYAAPRALLRELGNRLVARSPRRKRGRGANVASTANGLGRKIPWRR